jgi:hypothetical protein
MLMSFKNGAIHKLKKMCVLCTGCLRCSKRQNGVVTHENATGNWYDWYRRIENMRATLPPLLSVVSLHQSQ